MSIEDLLRLQIQRYEDVLEISRLHPIASIQDIQDIILDIAYKEVSESLSNGNSLHTNSYMIHRNGEEIEKIEYYPP